MLAAAEPAALETSVLPSTATAYLADFPVGFRFPSMGIPPELVSATETRRRQFVAGRYCAERALQALGVKPVRASVPRDPAGAPLWPAGVVGSITHTGTLAAAAAAWQDDLLGLGIDCEPIVTEAQARRLNGSVVLPEETRLGESVFQPAVWFTVVFSAKESVFKCLYPLVGRRFDYACVALERYHAPTGAFHARLLADLSPALREGRTIAGRCQLIGGVVHTGAWLPRRTPDATGHAIDPQGAGRTAR
jgi:enterobactin synthetase component D